jgi:hypothetical protein
MNNILRAKSYDAIRTEIFAHRESFEALVWNYLKAKQNGARLPELRAYLKNVPDFESFYDRVMNDIHKHENDSASANALDETPVLDHDDSTAQELGPVSAEAADVVMHTEGDTADQPSAMEEAATQPAHDTEGGTIPSVAQTPEPTPESVVEEEGEIKQSSPQDMEVSAPETTPETAPETIPPEEVRRRRIEMISNAARDATNIQKQLMTSNMVYPGNLNNNQRTDFFNTGVCNASLGFNFFHRAGFFPSSSGGGASSQPVSEGGGASSQPVSEGGGASSQPVSEGGGASSQPVSEGGGASSQPVSEGGGASSQPVSEGGDATSQPVSERSDRIFDAVYAHGDLHGDFEVFKSFLKICNIATIEGTYNDPRILWNSEKTNIAVIFIGDIVDRFRPGVAYMPSNLPGNSGTRAIGEFVDEEYYLERAINELSFRAQENNSAVIKLYGNHEFNNLLGGNIHVDFGPSRYMSDYLKYNLASETVPNEGKIKDRADMNQRALRQRVAQFLPGGKMNREISYCNPSVIFQINDHVFVHGGISLRVIDYVASKLENFHLYEIANSLAWKLWSGHQLSADETTHFSNIVGFYDSPYANTLLWDRTFSELEPPEGFETMSAYIESVISKLNEHNKKFGVPDVKGIVVAHSLPYLTLWDSSEKQNDYPRLRSIANNNYPSSGVVMDMIYKRQIIKKGGIDRNYVIFTDMNASRTFKRSFFKPDGVDTVGNSHETDLRVRPLKISSTGQLTRLYRDDLNEPTQESSVGTWPTMPWHAQPPQA